MGWEGSRRRPRSASTAHSNWKRPYVDPHLCATTSADDLVIPTIRTGVVFM